MGTACLSHSARSEVHSYADQQIAARQWRCRLDERGCGVGQAIGQVLALYVELPLVATGTPLIAGPKVQHPIAWGLRFVLRRAVLAQHLRPFGHGVPA